MRFEQFYGKDYKKLIEAKKQLEALIDDFQKRDPGSNNENIIAYFKSRIKTPQSMMKKLKKKHLSICADAALHQVNDAVGIWIICSFFDDIYRISQWIQEQEWLEIVKIKDYIAYPKKRLSQLSYDCFFAASGCYGRDSDSDHSVRLLGKSGTADEI